MVDHITQAAYLLSAALFIADCAKFVVANKRSMNPGFAGIENELYYADNTLMLFGDAKTALGEVVKELSGGAGH